jgi:RNA-directed DNA polymerase
MSDEKADKPANPVSAPESEGEAQRIGSGRRESQIAEGETESPTTTEQLMEEVCERENLLQALKKVQANKGGPGIDGMTVELLPDCLERQWPAIREQLLAGSYKPQPVKRVEIAKPDGGIRKLGIPTVVDRFIQQAALQVLQKQWDATFSEHSYGFRPQRSAHQAVAQAQSYIAEGYKVVVDIDLEKFFDRVNHDILMSRAARRIQDKRMLKLIRAFLNSGVMEQGIVSRTEEGTPQGGPLSPLLSNLLLDDLDKELERRGLRFCRYADDCNIYVKSQQAGQRAMESVSRFLEGKLKLKINKEKSAVARAGERKFLGFTIRGIKQPKRCIAQKALKRFKHRIREITARGRGQSAAQAIGTLSRYMRGWKGYFGFCQTPTVLRGLDQWIRRRLRCKIWEQWKTAKNRYAQLRKLGVERLQAVKLAGCSIGAWRASKTKTLSTALTTAYFTTVGLPQLEAK